MKKSTFAIILAVLMAMILVGCSENIPPMGQTTPTQIPDSESVSSPTSENVDLGAEASPNTVDASDEPTFAPRTEEQVLEDLLSSKLFRENYLRFTIKDLTIVKRQTDIEDRYDKVFVSIQVANDNETIETYVPGTITGNADFLLTYGLYNNGWILDSCEIDDSGAYGSGEFHASAAETKSDDDILELIHEYWGDVDSFSYTCTFEPDSETEVFEIQAKSDYQYVTEDIGITLRFTFAGNHYMTMSDATFEQFDKWPRREIVAEDWKLEGLYDLYFSYFSYFSPQPNQVKLSGTNLNDGLSLEVSTDKTILFDAPQSTNGCSVEDVLHSMNDSVVLSESDTLRWRSGPDMEDYDNPTLSDFRYFLPNEYGTLVLLVGRSRIALLSTQYERQLRGSGKVWNFEFGELEPVG